MIETVQDGGKMRRPKSFHYNESSEERWYDTFFTSSNYLVFFPDPKHSHFDL